MFTHKITNEDKFSEQVTDIDLSGLTKLTPCGTAAVGAIEIEPTGKPWKGWTGEHGFKDYEEEFGFAIAQL